MDKWNRRAKVKTLRSGIFGFMAGIDLEALRPMIAKVDQAHSRFCQTPMAADSANYLENTVLVSSFQSTDAIEGGALSVRETREALELSGGTEDENQLRVTNIRDAYGQAAELAGIWIDEMNQFNEFGEPTPPVEMDEGMITDFHKKITQGLTHPRNVPGEYRDNPKDMPTLIGDESHGGVHKPPKCLKDVETLMKGYIDWVNSEPISSLPPLVRAPLAHLYFELIHPFWDGNGRVGRVIETLILKAAGYKYASYAVSTYYLTHIDEYFTNFNTARKAQEKKKPFPNMVFVRFFLEAMLDVINGHYGYACQENSRAVYELDLRRMIDAKKINSRQYTIAANLLVHGERHNLNRIQAEPWYRALYIGLSRHTAARDLKGLGENKLIEIDKDKNIRLLLP